MAENRARADTAADPKAPAAVRRWVQVALAVSLAINLLVAGMFLGLRINPPAAPGAGAPPRVDARVLRDLGLGPFLNAFPPKVKRQMAQRIRQEVIRLGDGRQELVRELDQMLALLRADSLDEAALAEVFRRQTQRLNQRTEIGREIVLEAITSMTPQERHAFAARLEKILRRAMAGQNQQARRPGDGPPSGPRRTPQFPQGDRPSK